MYKIILSLLIAACFVSCNRRKDDGANDARNKTVKPIIVIINQTRTQNEVFKYIDCFNNSQLSLFNGNDTLRIDGSAPIVFYETNTPDFSDLRYYVLKSSDTAYLVKDGNETVLRSKNSVLRQNIDLMSALLFNVGSMNYSNNNDFATGVKKINDFYLNKKRILGNYVNKTESKTCNEANKIVEYDKLASMLALDARFDKRSDTLLTAFKDADSTSWDYLTFRNAIANYILYANKVHHAISANQYVDDIRTNLPAAVQDYAIYSYLKNYKPDTKGKLDTLTAQVAAFNKNAVHKNLANYLFENLEKYRLGLEVRDSKGIELKAPGSGKTISFDQVLNQFKGKIIYLDFWASWCAPCLAEMPASHTLAEKFKNDKSDIVFLYLSKDADMSAWKHKASEIGLPESNSFIILTNKAFMNFSDRFNLRTIPRYMIIGKKGEIIDADASRPSDAKLKLFLDKLLKG